MTNYDIKLSSGKPVKIDLDKLERSKENSDALFCALFKELLRDHHFVCKYHRWVTDALEKGRLTDDWPNQLMNILHASFYNPKEGFIPLLFQPENSIRQKKFKKLLFDWFEQQVTTLLKNKQYFQNNPNIKHFNQQLNNLMQELYICEIVSNAKILLLGQSENHRETISKHILHLAMYRFDLVCPDLMIKPTLREALKKSILKSMTEDFDCDRENQTVELSLMLRVFLGADKVDAFSYAEPIALIQNWKRIRKNELEFILDFNFCAQEMNLKYQDLCGLHDLQQSAIANVDPGWTSIEDFARILDAELRKKSLLIYPSIGISCGLIAFNCLAFGPLSIVTSCITLASLSAINIYRYLHPSAQIMSNEQSDKETALLLKRWDDQVKNAIVRKPKTIQQKKDHSYNAELPTPDSELIRLMNYCDKRAKTTRYKTNKAPNTIEENISTEIPNISSEPNTTALIAKKMDWQTEHIHPLSGSENIYIYLDLEKMINNGAQDLVSDAKKTQTASKTNKQGYKRLQNSQKHTFFEIKSKGKSRYLLGLFHITIDEQNSVGALDTSKGRHYPNGFHKKSDKEKFNRLTVDTLGNIK